nr:hypothetical protein GCM10020092_000230 [Actinoplanes digitatis]
MLSCKKVKGDKTKVRCTAKVKLVSVRVYLRDGNDTLVNKSTLSLAGDGGSGKDKITGGEGRDTLWGGAGADILRGVGGIDFIYGDVSNSRRHRRGRPARGRQRHHLRRRRQRLHRGERQPQHDLRPG